jgi:hypothetical protein
MSLWLGQSGRRCALAGRFIWSLSKHQTTITLNRTARATLFVVCLVVAQSSSAAAAFIACRSMSRRLWIGNAHPQKKQRSAEANID